MVLSPPELVQEIHQLADAGMLRGTLHVSERAHLILPWHRLEDAWEEEMRGGHPTGTTLRGIGPAYRDRVGRWGLRMADLSHPKLLKEKLERLFPTKARMEKEGRTLQAVDSVAEELRVAGEALAPYIRPTEPLLWKALDRGENVLLEGAQGTMLDIDYGTYPFTTSSHTTLAGAFSGSGLAPTQLTEVIGVTKAYTTRVGNGPFPTELKDEVGERIRQKGGEMGSTTGRPRRCGWLDLVLLRYAARLNGFTSLSVMKTDVLGGEENVKVCVAYKGKDGRRLEDHPPALAEDLDAVEPVYETLPGWGEITPKLKEKLEDEGWEALPPALTSYLTYISHKVGAPIRIVSYGPRREETVMLPPEQPVASTRPISEWKGGLA
jgi:adenylosuccinate synthase